MKNRNRYIKNALLFFGAILLCGCSTFCQKEETSDCSTRYPVLLVHGVAARDDWSVLRYWGKIEEELIACGTELYLGNQNAYDTHENNARMIAAQMKRIMKENPHIEKFNIVAHSKGGLESRYLISRLGMAPYVASLTTLCTPHRGTVLADWGVNDILNDKLNGNQLIPSVVDVVAFIMGDDKPHAYLSWKELTSSYMEEFNRNVPDQPGIYYQSWASVMDRYYPSAVPVLLHNFIYKRDGANDGLVSVNSARWGVFRGIVPDGGIEGGVSHADMVDNSTRGDELHFDAPAFYVSVVSELKRMGF